MTHEGTEVEAALAGKKAVMTAPREHVHGQEGGIRQLDEEDLAGRDRLDRFRVVTLRQDVEAVEAHPDQGMISEAHDAGGRLVAVDEPAPRERLVGDSHAKALGEIPELTQLRRRKLLVSAARCPDVAAEQHGLDAETVHQRELRRRAPQVLLEQVRADAFEVAEGLVQIERQPELLRPRPDRLGRVRRCDEVGLEHLHPIEPGLLRGEELLIERAAEADRCDRRAHDTSTRHRRWRPCDSQSSIAFRLYYLVRSIHRGIEGDSTPLEGDPR